MRNLGGVYCVKVDAVRVHRCQVLIVEVKKCRDCGRIKRRSGLIRKVTERGNVLQKRKRGLLWTIVAPGFSRLPVTEPLQIQRRVLPRSDPCSGCRSTRRWHSIQQQHLGPDQDQRTRSSLAPVIAWISTEHGDYRSLCARQGIERKRCECRRWNRIQIDQRGRSK